jgi:hypothetical protein
MAARAPAASAPSADNFEVRLGGGEAANDAALAPLADPEEDSLRAARGFAAALGLGAGLWVALGALVWLGLR